MKEVIASFCSFMLLILNFSRLVIFDEASNSTYETSLQKKKLNLNIFGVHVVIKYRFTKGESYQFVLDIAFDRNI